MVSVPDSAMDSRVARVRGSACPSRHRGGEGQYRSEGTAAVSVLPDTFCVHRECSPRPMRRWIVREQQGSGSGIALLSPVVAGWVRTWTSGASRLWSVDRPEALSARLACGRALRRPVRDGRLREVGVLLGGRGTLLVPDHPVPAGDRPGGTDVDSFRLTALEPPRGARGVATGPQRGRAG